MKKTVALILFICVLNATDGISQCNAENLSNECIPKLAGGFIFLKTYKVDGVGGTKEKVEYSYPFAKGTQYMIKVCSPSQPTDGIIVNLYDPNRNKVASSKINGLLISTLSFACNTSGIYYIEYTFDGSASYCGGSVLGFKIPR